MTTDSANSAPRSGKVRLLVLSDEMEVGGTQRQIVHIVNGLDRSLFEPTVAYFSNRSFLVDEMERAGVHVVEIPKRSRIDPAFVSSLVRFVREGRFDIVHCFSFTGELWGAVARRFISRSNRPLLISSVRSTYDWYTPMQWRVKRWVSLQSRSVIANSLAGGDAARARMRLPPTAVEVIYNGVADAPADVLATVPASAMRGSITALFVGRLVGHKNLPVLLRAMKRLHGEGIPVKLQIAGDGPLRQACADQIDALGLQSTVELLGERSDTLMLMAAADFIVLPSLREGLSNVILEAMVTGRAVVASAVGGNVELVEPMTNGLLFPNDDDAALADAMRQLAEDKGLRERLGTQGRRLAVERFTVAAMVRAMHDCYLRCVASRPAPAATRKA